VSEAFSKRSLERLLADARPLLEGDAELVGKYRIVGEIGRGGMGIVYEALDVELGRRVALKVIALPPGAPEAARERFVREARAAARLNHPGIAAVYDAFDGAIAMQLVDGLPLSRAPRDDRRRLVRLVRDAALAVHYAHEQGVVHRDLKPHNLLVEGERVVVTDFGLAKDAAEVRELSLSGHVLGTPAYMSPEQAQGRVHDIDPRTDVYGLGATLYDLLAGSPPFAERDVARLLKAVIDDDPRPIRSLAPDVPRDLELVVLKCLSKERERRYPSARSLAEDLTRWLDGDVVRAEAPSFRYRAGKFVRRRRALIGLSTATALALAIALASTASERAQRRASSESLALGQRVSGVLADADTHRRLGEVELANARLDQGIAAAREFMVRHDVADAHYLLGRMQRARGLAREARVSLDRALELSPTLVEARYERGLLVAAELATDAARSNPPVSVDEPQRMSPELAAQREIALADLRAVAADPGSLRDVDAMFARAELARLSGERAAARKLLDEVARLDPVHVGARLALSQLSLAEGDSDTAWHLAMSAVDLYRGFGPAYVARSQVYERTVSDTEPGPFERVVRRHELTAAEERIAAGDRSPEALQLRGSARLSIDDIDGALADFAAAVRADPSDAFAFGNRGLVHARKAARLCSEDRTDEALDAWQDAIADYEAALTIEPTLAGAYNNLGVCRSERERLLDESGNTQAAAAERELAGRAFESASSAAPRFALAHLNHGMQRRRVAQAHARALDLGAARASVEEALRDFERVLELNPDDAGAYSERALAYEQAGRIGAAANDEGLTLRVFASARTDHDTAVRIAPKDVRARGLRGLFLLQHGERDAGRADVIAALAMAPDRRLRTQLEAALRTSTIAQPAPEK
jgi:serine/threonine-protein kinase